MGIGIALFYDQINILAEDVTFCNLHLWEKPFAICICGKTGLSLEGNTVQAKVIWFGFRSIGNSVWTKLPE